MTWNRTYGMLAGASRSSVSYPRVPAFLSWPKVTVSGHGSALPVMSVTLALVFGGICIALFGSAPRGIRHSLDVTARWSYLWFWLAYAGGALPLITGQRFGGIVARHRREFGLAFASAHSVHLLLVIWLYQVSAKAPVPVGVAVFFGIGACFMYLMAILSIKRVAGLLSPWLWRSIMFIGLEYVEYAFLVDFWINPLRAGPKQWIEYLPFALLGLFGTAIRLTRGYGVVRFLCSSR